MPDMYSLMQHEIDRWKSMDERRLRTRLTRMRKPEKIACFIAIANMIGAQYLADVGLEHTQNLGNYNNVVFTHVPQVMVTEQDLDMMRAGLASARLRRPSRLIIDRGDYDPAVPDDPPETREMVEEQMENPDVRQVVEDDTEEYMESSRKLRAARARLREKLEKQAQDMGIMEIHPRKIRFKPKPKKERQIRMRKKKR